MALIDKSPWDSNAVFIFFCNFCNLVPGLFFLEGKALGTRLHFWVPIQNGRSFSKLFLQFSRNFPSRVENISTLKGNFVSPRGHVISSIVTCDQAIFLGGGGGGKKQYFPRQKEKIAWSQVTSIEACLFWFVAYGTRNIAFEARLFCFMAYRTRNITFQVR